MSQEIDDEMKPKDCFECKFFGKNGEHLKSGKAHFPSLCEKDLLFFDCNGKQGEIRDSKKEVSGGEKVRSAAHTENRYKDFDMNEYSWDKDYNIGSEAHDD